MKNIRKVATKPEFPKYTAILLQIHLHHHLDMADADVSVCLCDELMTTYFLPDRTALP